MVLLKNDGVLPLTAGGAVKTVALIGPYVDSRANKDYMSFWTLGLGNPDYNPAKIVTPAQGLKPALEAENLEGLRYASCTRNAPDNLSATPVSGTVFMMCTQKPVNAAHQTLAVPSTAVGPDSSASKVTSV